MHDPFACSCPECQAASATTRDGHRHLRVVLARLDEGQRRWVAALEALRLGHGGIRRVARITGLDEKTIRRGCREVQSDLVTRPVDRIRLPGAGRPSTEKNIPTSKTA
jgi:hypothetical protein